jgi:hypothetical protein
MESSPGVTMAYRYFRRTKDIVANAPPLKPLIYPLFVLEHLTMIIGDAGTCKTTLIAGLANKAVKGMEFLGLVPMLPVKVVIFDLESGDALIGDRYKEVLQVNDISPDIWTCNEPVTWKEAKEELVRLIRTEGINLVFLDHLYLAYPPEDASSAKEAIELMRDQRDFARQERICIASLLHPPLETRGGIRKGFGSIFKTNSVDIQVNLTPDELAKDLVTLEVPKDRCYNSNLHFIFRKTEGRFIKVKDLTELSPKVLSKAEQCRNTLTMLMTNGPQPTVYFIEQLKAFKECMVKVELSHLVEEKIILRPKYGFYMRKEANETY